MRKPGILIESNNVSSPNILLQALADRLTSDVEIIGFNDTSDSETTAITEQQQNGWIRVMNRDRSSISTSQNTDTYFCDLEYIWFVNPTITVVDNVVAQLLELIERQPSDCYTLGFQQGKPRQAKNISSTTIRHDTKECTSNSCDQIFTDAALLESSNKVFSYAAIARSGASHFPGHTSMANATFTLHEIRISPGLLPKPLVLILRFGKWTERIPYRLIALPFKLVHRIIDLLYCKLLLNCDIPAALFLGRNVIFYHPYGISASAELVIVSDFIYRYQVTIGSKGKGKLTASCPTMRDPVEARVGAKIFGPIGIDTYYAIAQMPGTPRHYPTRSLVGVPS